MEYTIRMMGYNITINKPQECNSCHKKTNMNLLERIVDNTDGVIKYILVLKCPVCNEITFVSYIVGKEKDLPTIEKESNDNPINPFKVV